MSKGKLLAVCCVWLVILAVVAAAWKLIIAPAREEAAREKKEQQEEELVEGTSADGWYEHEIRFALDSFSGYAVFRSEDFRNELRGRKIKLRLHDDQADYSQRIRDLKGGKVQLAAFTVDALVKVTADLGEPYPPATIVAIIDETRGADAMVAYKEAISDYEALNRPETKFVLTPDSPSETLARVVMAHFKLDRLGPKPFVEADGAKDVCRRFEKSKPDAPRAFVLWEPYVSQALQRPGATVVIDSSKFRGYIVDVIVANRKYLKENTGRVGDFLQAYFSALYTNRDKMPELVLKDAREAGESLSQQQAEKLVAGVWWKNTVENYAHFGIRQGTTLQHIEDMIDRITRVLVSTGGISSDPTQGKPNLLYYDGILRERLWEPGFTPSELEPEQPREDLVKLPPLTREQWERLVPVGELKVPPLDFYPGRPTPTDQSYMALDELIKTLKTFPDYYLLIRGNASLRGDLRLNKILAQQRAEEAAKYLIDNGIDRDRVHVPEAEPRGSTSVSFVLGHPPY